MQFKWHHVVLALGLMAALWPLFFGQFYLTGDMYDVFVPLENFFRSEQLHGRIPVWHPGIAWGYPTIASAQIGFFYPPLFALRPLPISAYIPIIFALHIAAATLGTYLFARRVALSTTAATIAALAFGLSQSVWQHATHLNIILAIAWFPWQLLAVDLVVRNKLSPQRSLALLATVWGVPFLIGQLQIPLLAALISFNYLLYRLCSDASRVVAFTLIGPSILLTLAMAATQLLPTAQLALQSDRGSSEFSIQQANQYSWPVYHAPTILFPRFFGNDETYWGKRLEIEQGFFIGAIPLLLAVLALVKRTKKDHFWLALAGVSFLLALGDFSPFRLIGLEPSLWIFSGPARWLLFTSFAIAMLAGRGWNMIAATRGTGKTLLVVSLTAVVITVVITNVAVSLLSPASILSALQTVSPDFLSADTSYNVAKVEQILQSLRSSGVSLASPFTWLTLIALILGAYAIYARREKLLLAVIVSELVAVAATTSPVLPWRDSLLAPSSYAELPESVQTGTARLLSIQPTGGDTGALLTNPNSRPSATDRFTNRALLAPLSHTLFGVSGVAWPASLPLVQRDALLDDLREAWRAGDHDTIATFNIGAVAEKSTDEVGVAAITPAERVRVAPPSAGTASAVLQLTPSELTFTAETTEPATILLNDTWYPGWKAWVNGTPVDIERTTDSFKMLSLPAGSHNISLQYQPIMLTVAMAVSGGASIILILLFRPRKKT